MGKLNTEKTKWSMPISGQTQCREGGVVNANKADRSMPTKADQANLEGAGKSMPMKANS